MENKNKINDGKIYFSIKDNDLYILKRVGYDDYEVVNKYNASIYITDLYDDIRHILNSFYNKFEKLNDMEIHQDDKASDYINKCGILSCRLNELIDQDLTISKLRMAFDVLIDYSEDNPLLCCPSFVKKYNSDNFLNFRSSYSSNYESSLVFINNEVLNVVRTYGFVRFVAYVCYTANESIKRFKICPTCMNGIIDGNTSRFFCTDAHKSRYNWLTKKEPVLNEYKQNINKLSNFLKHDVSKEDKDKFKDAINDFVKHVRPALYRRIVWVDLTKDKLDIFDSAFQQVDKYSTSNLKGYKEIANKAWNDISRKYGLNKYNVTID